MEINPIYLNYTEGQPSFELTITILEKIIRQRLSNDYKSIRVGASNSSKVKFCFTVFNNDGSYNFYFQEMKNFRNWRPLENIGVEVAHMENLIETLRSGCLSGIIL